MFPGSVIRKLAHSEEVFAQYEVFTSITVQLQRSLSMSMRLSEAFDALRSRPTRCSPVTSSKSPMAVGYIVADDLLHSGIWVVDGNTGRRRETPEFSSIRRASLFNLRLTLRRGRVRADGVSSITASPTVTISASLLDELFVPVHRRGSYR